MSEWYTKWAARHAAMFGMSRAEDATTFSAWRSLFMSKSYTEQELNHATNVIAARPEPLAWRDHHLAAINSAIRELRQVAIRRENNEVSTEEKPKCAYCSDSGCVIVPHPRFVFNGSWVTYCGGKPTSAVICSCYRGRRIRDYEQESGREKKQMTIEEYERRIPRDLWQNLFDQQRLERMAEVRADVETKEQDSRLGILSRLARGIGEIPQNGD